MKTANDLKSNPQPIKRPDEKEAPIQTAYRHLTVTEGKQLEIMSRSNPTLAKAAHLAFIFNSTIAHDLPDGIESVGIPYVEGYITLVERMSVALDGKGRQELIDALGAGGKLPDAYYDAKSGQKFVVVGNDD